MPVAGAEFEATLSAIEPTTEPPQTRHRNVWAETEKRRCSYP